MSAEELELVKELKELIDIVKKMVDAQNLLFQNHSRYLQLLDERTTQIEKHLVL